MPVTPGPNIGLHWVTGTFNFRATPRRSAYPSLAALLALDLKLIRAECRANSCQIGAAFAVSGLALRRAAFRACLF
jgi:hypothetical protein